MTLWSDGYVGSLLHSSAKPALHGWMGVYMCVLRSRVRGCRVSVTSQYNGPNTDVSLLGVTRPLRTPESHQNDHARPGGKATDGRACEKGKRKKEKGKSDERNELRHLQRARTKVRAERITYGDSTDPTACSLQLQKVHSSHRARAYYIYGGVAQTGWTGLVPP